MNKEEEEIFMKPIRKQEIIKMLKEYNLLDDKNLEPINSLLDSDIISLDAAAFYWNLFINQDTSSNTKESDQNDLMQKSSLDISDDDLDISKSSENLENIPWTELMEPKNNANLEELENILIQLDDSLVSWEKASLKIFDKYTKIVQNETDSYKGETSAKSEGSSNIEELTKYDDNNEEVYELNYVLLENKEQENNMGNVFDLDKRINDLMKELDDDNAEMKQMNEQINEYKEELTRAEKLIPNELCEQACFKENLTMLDIFKEIQEQNNFDDNKEISEDHDNKILQDSLDKIKDQSKFEDMKKIDGNDINVTLQDTSEEIKGQNHFEDNKEISDIVFENIKMYDFSLDRQFFDTILDDSLEEMKKQNMAMLEKLEQINIFDDEKINEENDIKIDERQIPDVPLQDSLEEMKEQNNFEDKKEIKENNANITLQDTLGQMEEQNCFEEKKINEENYTEIDEVNFDHHAFVRQIFVAILQDSLNETTEENKDNKARNEENDINISMQDTFEEKKDKNLEDNKIKKKDDQQSLDTNSILKEFLEEMDNNFDDKKVINEENDISFARKSLNTNLTLNKEKINDVSVIREPLNANSVLNDTLEEIEVLMKYGERYMKRESIMNKKASKFQLKKEINFGRSKSENSIFGKNKISQVPFFKSPQPKKVIQKQKVKTPTSATKSTIHNEPEFKIPSSRPPRRRIQSPIGEYIRNSPTTPLIKKIMSSPTNRPIKLTNYKEILREKGNVTPIKLPMKTYKPASKHIFVEKENEPNIPNNIKKLYSSPMPLIIKHIGRAPSEEYLTCSNSEFNNTAELTVLSETKMSEFEATKEDAKKEVSLYVGKKPVRSNSLKRNVKQ